MLDSGYSLKRLTYIVFIEFDNHKQKLEKLFKNHLRKASGCFTMIIRGSVIYFDLLYSMMLMNLPAGYL
jgi:hypothetical protein